jgi:hypothetical protein
LEKSTHYPKARDFPPGCGNWLSTFDVTTVLGILAAATARLNGFTFGWGFAVRPVSEMARPCNGKRGSSKNDERLACASVALQAVSFLDRDTVVTDRHIQEMERLVFLSSSSRY